MSQWYDAMVVVAAGGGGGGGSGGGRGRGRSEMLDAMVEQFSQ